jgi:ABC-type lipoprotein export system ATPase subunit
MLCLITFLKDHRCFKQGEVLRLDTGNSLVLVGDQGTGKSSIFDLMNHLNKYKDVVTINYEGPQKTRFFDSEKMNPRVQQNLGGSGASFGIGIFGLFNSHGQTMLPVMTAPDLLESSEPITIIVDEPENGLSLMSQLKLLEYYQKALQLGHCVIIATHSPILMKLNSCVYDVPRRQAIPANEYIRSIIGNLLD